MNMETTDRYCNCEPWYPSEVECDVIEILSNLGDYLTPGRDEVAQPEKLIYVEKELGISNTVVSYCELCNSSRVRKITSPSWPRRNFKASTSTPVRTITNPYGGAVGDGRMYVSLLPKPLERRTFSSFKDTEITINLGEHEGWEELDFLVDAQVNSADKQ